MNKILGISLIAGAFITAPISAQAGGCGMKSYSKHHQYGYPHAKRHHPMYKKSYSYKKGYPMYHQKSYSQQSYGRHAFPALAYSNQSNSSTTDNQTSKSQASLNIIDTAASSGQFNTLVEAIKSAGLVETLQGPGPFTVFAPNDEAFSKMPEQILNALVSDKEALTELLTFHLVPGKVSSEDVVKLTTAKSVQGSNLSIDTSDGVKINGARLVQADIETSNGIIHVIDSVVLPN